jgi:hypothetical protein
MKRLLSAALIASVALSASAQRGGGHGGFSGSAGHGGGFAGHSGSFSSRSAPAASFSGRTSFAAASRPSVSAYSAPYAANFRRPPNPEPFFNNRRGNGGVYRLPYIPTYGLALPYGPALYGPNCLGYADCGYDDSAYTAPPAPAYNPPDQYQAQPAGPQTSEQADATPPDTFRPPYQRPQPEPEPEDAVTLIFKDGRPSEQVRNYMLTRSALYVLDATHSIIPVDQLDLAATVKVNSDAGVAFQLPQASR